MAWEERKEADGEDGISSQNDGLKNEGSAFFFFFLELYLSFHSYLAPEKKQAYDESIASYLGREKASTPFPSCPLSL